MNFEKLVRPLIIIFLITFMVMIHVAVNAAINKNNETITVNCIVKGHSINGVRLELFIELNVYQPYTSSNQMPFKEISEAIIKAIPPYKKANDLDKYSDDNTFITITSLNMY